MGRDKAGAFAIASIFLGALLMQGCSTETDQAATTPKAAGTPAVKRQDHASGAEGRTDAGAKEAQRRWPFIGSGEATALSVKDLLRTNYYVVADGSGSMAGSTCGDGRTKLEVAKDALSMFGQSVPADANLGLAAFDRRGTSERVSLGTGNRDVFAAEIRALGPRGRTPLKTSIELAYEKLTEQARAQLGYGEYHLVVVTDGEADQGEAPNPIVNKVLTESAVIIHTIGFCIDEHHSLNQPGRTRYQAANDYSSLSRGLADVLAEAPEFSAATFE